MSSYQKKINNHSKNLNEKDNLNNSDEQVKNIKTVKRDDSCYLRDAEFGWKQIETIGSVTPSDYTITNVNQNHDLQRYEVTKKAPQMHMNSKEWLSIYGIESMQLSLKDLLSKGVINK